MTRGLFVTGTDTGVGKTLIAAGILRWLRNQSIDAVPMKPVQTGAQSNGQKLTAPDLEFSLAAAHLQPDDAERRSMAPYIYAPACSPHLAGRLMQKYVDLSHIQNCITFLLERHRFLVIEGAGGILVPLNENQTMLDLMQILGYPVILVSRPGLGTINHTLLSVRVLKTAGLKILGVIFNQTQPAVLEDRPIETDNPETIAKFGETITLGKVAYTPTPLPDNDQLWSNFENQLPELKNMLMDLNI